jgi:hypothetical protein
MPRRAAMHLFPHPLEIAADKRDVRRMNPINVAAELVQENDRWWFRASAWLAGIPRKSAAEKA